MNKNTVILKNSQSNNDHTDLDAAFISSFLSTNTNWLDVGSGSGLIINRLFQKAKQITCIEPVRKYAEQIVKIENVKIFNSTIEHFNTVQKFDLVTAFGTMQYFSYDEALNVYKKIRTILNCNKSTCCDRFFYSAGGGRLIVKNQFGLKSRVVVNRFSEELQRHYVSEYRTLDEEISLLKSVGFSEFEVVDIYEPYMNRFDYTHYYAIVATI